MQWLDEEISYVSVNDGDQASKSRRSSGERDHKEYRVSQSARGAIERFSPEACGTIVVTMASSNLNHRYEGGGYGKGELQLPLGSLGAEISSLISVDGRVCCANCKKELAAC